MSKKVYCDKCDAIMNEQKCEESFGKSATLLSCPNCHYKYEIGLRYNPFIQEYVKYYKFI